MGEDVLKSVLFAFSFLLGFFFHTNLGIYLPYVSCIPAINNEMNANTNNKLMYLPPLLLLNHLRLVGMVHDPFPLQLGDQDQESSSLLQVLGSVESHHS